MCNLRKLPLYEPTRPDSGQPVGAGIMSYYYDDMYGADAYGDCGASADLYGGGRNRVSRKRRAQNRRRAAAAAAAEAADAHEEAQEEAHEEAHEEAQEEAHEEAQEEAAEEVAKGVRAAAVPLAHRRVMPDWTGAKKKPDRKAKTPRSAKFQHPDCPPSKLTPVGKRPANDRARRASYRVKSCNKFHDPAFQGRTKHLTPVQASRRAFMSKSEVGLRRSGFGSLGTLRTGGRVVTRADLRRTKNGTYFVAVERPVTPKLLAWAKAQALVRANDSEEGTVTVENVVRRHSNRKIVLAKKDGDAEERGLYRAIKDQYTKLLGSAQVMAEFEKQAAKSKKRALKKNDALYDRTRSGNSHVFRTARWHALGQYPQYKGVIPKEAGGSKEQAEWFEVLKRYNSETRKLHDSNDASEKAEYARLVKKYNDRKKGDDAVTLARKKKEERDASKAARAQTRSARIFAQERARK